MKPSVLALLFALLGLAPAQAQVNFTSPPPAGIVIGGVMVVTTCGQVNLANGSLAVLAMDHTGALCTNATGGGGGASATFGAAFPTTGTPPGFTIGGLFQPWNGLTAGGVNYGLVGVVDNTGTQLNGYTTGPAGTAASQAITVQGIAGMTPVIINQTQVGGATLSLGQTTKSASLPVTIASDQGLATSPAAAATGGATYAHIAAGQATTVVKASAGTLYSICLNSAATATNTTNVYDNASTSGTIIATVAATTATVPTCLQYGPVGIAAANGIVIITATANGADMTVAFK